MDNKKRNILIAAAIAVPLLIVIIIWVFIFSLPKPASEVMSEEAVETESDVAVIEEDSVLSLIDAQPIEVEEEKMIAVMIENHTDSRRQMSGLAEASLVFETEAEGGITRFLAFYPYQNTEKVGPVRSVRPYFVRWAEQFDSALAHAGGSDMGLSAIYNSGRAYDLEGLALEGADEYFIRDYTYYAPHNLFANLEELRELMDDRGWDKPIEDPFVTFGEQEIDDPLGEEAYSADTVHIYYPFPQYFVRYDYDEENDVYERNQAGAPHIDHATETQITAANVVVMITNYYPTDEEGRLYLKTEGSGSMYLFRNGKVHSGTWSKLNSQDTLKFYDENDVELKFEEGNTWVSVVNFQGGLQWE
ncbi:DUF3048 domain-containing protein [Patescibacteria group bacterium]